ncbi:MAG: 16S rRNA (guanine(527)-N(7))-methyltransferase RsmG, partial [Elusimicrobiaceae bacterium]|nr:16S rRNA (guanine(527)-N(7))-methyltransferase RsmG [Elusimicrobiaceae bacterium]
PFAKQLSLSLSTKQLGQLTAYAKCVWEKKDFLNLTSVQTFDEIFTRHLADGLVAASQIAAVSSTKKWETPQIADVGSGAGYIGFTLAITLPQAKVTCIESLEKRCSFMNWAALKIGISNLSVKNARLGQGNSLQFDSVTERAMGQLPDIVDICMDVVKPGGIFLAYQGEHPQTHDCILPQNSFVQGEFEYYLPCADNKKRHIVLFEKRSSAS